MKRRIVPTLSGREITIWTPESEADQRFLDEMYERGDLQRGDSVKEKHGKREPAAR